jgi:AcrR family transcriptional regulator
MSAGYPESGRSNPVRSIELLWGTRERSTRGPSPGLSVSQIVTAAIALADADGLEALSMRRVAERLGGGAMSLYRYIPGKAELLDLMVDRVSAEVCDPAAAGAADLPAGWRARLEQVARANRRLYERHPWLLHLPPGRPPLGPGVIGKYDYELRAVDGIGLTDVEMDSVLALVLGYVRHATASVIEWPKVLERTGQTDDEWWTAISPLLNRLLDPERYPLAVRVGTAATEHYRGAYDPEHAFEFGLQRILDGIETLIANERRVVGHEQYRPRRSRNELRGVE